MPFSCSSHLDLNYFFVFDKSCLLIKIALSNGHNVLSVGSTYIIWNQGICYLIASAIPWTPRGDPILGLKMSGLGKQHSLPMQLKFGWNRVSSQPDKTGKFWDWCLSPCFCLDMSGVPELSHSFLCLAPQFLTGSVLPHFCSLCLQVFLAWLPHYKSWYNFTCEHFISTSVHPFLFYLLPTYDCINFKQKMINSMRGFLMCVSFHYLLIIADYKKNDFLCHHLCKDVVTACPSCACSPSSELPGFIYDQLCAAVTIHPRPFKGSACVCTSVGTIGI